jgi:hypothetical protein
LNFETNRQPYHEHLVIFLRGNLQVSMEIWRMCNKFPSCSKREEVSW